MSRDMYQHVMRTIGSVILLAWCSHDVSGQQVIDLTGTIRDFRVTHPNMEIPLLFDVFQPEWNIVKPALGADGTPDFNVAAAPFERVTNAEDFFEWYHDVEGVNRSMDYSIALVERGTSGVFEFYDDAFFPIDRQLLGNQGSRHNFHFTYHIHAEFVYGGNEFLRVASDDDSWTFINNELAIDLGGVHDRLYTIIGLDDVGLTVGNTYPFDLFFAERHTGGSFLWIETNLNLTQPTETLLMAGDADQDLDFDQFDMIHVLKAAKYLTGEAATWGDGDWNGAPGGSPGRPPTGDGQFDQFDLIAALSTGLYLQGPYASRSNAIHVQKGPIQLGYSADTGEVWVETGSALGLTSINIRSANGIFTAGIAKHLNGRFDVDSDENIFKSVIGGSFGSVSFGRVAAPGLSEEFILSDLTAVGSLAGGGDVGNVDLIYVPEPSSAVLLGLGIVALGIRATLCNTARARNQQLPTQ